jgi:elongation factor P hydroxylase
LPFHTSRRQKKKSFLTLSACGRLLLCALRIPVFTMMIAPPPVTASHLIECFDSLFAVSENTRLIDGKQAGFDEPIYLPANGDCDYHRLVFAHGYLESALHEISHWCIAGAERRALMDFGYWYEPDGRSAQQQRAFEQVEIKPQALEWILSVACGRRFSISTDNLEGDPQAVTDGRQVFARSVAQQARIYGRNGLPARANVFKNALLDYYHRHAEFADYLFVAEQL